MKILKVSALSRAGRETADKRVEILDMDWVQIVGCRSDEDDMFHSI